MAWRGWSRKSLSLLLIVSLAFNIGVGVTFGVMAYRNLTTPRRPHGPGDGPGRFHSLRDLELSPEQETQMKAAREKMIERVHELRRAVREENRVLTELMTAPEPDREAIAGQVGRITAARQQMDRHVVEHFLDVRGLLDPDQQEAFNKTIRRAFSRGGPGARGLGGHHGPGKGRGHGREGRFRKNTELFDPNKQKETEE